VTTHGGKDIFVAKYSPYLQVQWAFNLGGVNDDTGPALDIDALGSVYISGTFHRLVDFDPGPGLAIMTAIGGGAAFLAKYDNDGNYVFACQFGGTGGAGTRSLDIDSSFYVYIAGNFTGTVDFDPDTPIVNLTNIGPGQDMFLANYDSTGDFVWATSHGNGGYNVLRYVC